MPTNRLLQRQREVANPYTGRKKGWNQVPPSDVLLPERQLAGTAMRGGEEENEEEGPDSLVPFPLLSGIALVGAQREGHARGRMGVGELREAMRELHSKASKLDFIADTCRTTQRLVLPPSSL